MPSQIAQLGGIYLEALVEVEGVVIGEAFLIDDAKEVLSRD